MTETKGTVITGSIHLNILQFKTIICLCTQTLNNEKKAGRTSQNYVYSTLPRQDDDKTYFLILLVKENF